MQRRFRKDLRVPSKHPHPMPIQVIWFLIFPEPIVRYVGQVLFALLIAYIALNLHVRTYLIVYY
jgi:hypothetical protein